MTHPEVGPDGNNATLSYNTTTHRSDKHELLLTRRGEELEISCPIGMLFPFFRQTTNFLNSMTFDVRLVVNPHYSNDALFTEDLPAVARARGIALTAAAEVGLNGVAEAADRTFAQLLPGITAAANNSHKLDITSIFLDTMYAKSAVPLGPIRSLQVPFSGVTLYTRALAAGQTSYTEVFSGLPPSASAVILAMRVDGHELGTNRELYQAGGGAAGFATAQLACGQLIQPSPAYSMNPSERRVGRPMADYLSFVGGDHRDGSGAMNVTEYCAAPLLTFRILQPASTFSPTASVRFTTTGAVAANTQLLFFVVHQRVLECQWPEGGASDPSSVVVDEVINA
jgi:hypothetical protein